MKYLLYISIWVFFLGHPAQLGKSQSANAPAIEPTKNTNEPQKKVVDSKDLEIAKLLPQANKALESTPKVKTKIVYRTKIKEVHDTVYLLLPPEPDSSFLAENPVDEPCDTVYLEKPRRKGFLKRIFN